MTLPITLPDGYSLYINIAILFFLFVFLWIGKKKGFLLQLVEIFGILVILFIASNFSGLLAENISIFPKEYFPVEELLFGNLLYQNINKICWFVIIVIAGLVILLLLKPITKFVNKIPIVKQVNQLLGMVLSAITYAVYLVLIIFVLTTPLFTNGNKIIETTWLQPVKENSMEAFRFIEEPLMKNEIIQKIINGEEITQDDLSVLTEWFNQEIKNSPWVFDFVKESLSKLGIEDEKALEILEEYMKENEISADASQNLIEQQINNNGIDKEFLSELLQQYMEENNIEDVTIQQLLEQLKEDNE